MELKLYAKLHLHIIILIFDVGVLCNIGVITRKCYNESLIHRLYRLWESSLDRVIYIYIYIQVMLSNRSPRAQ